MYVSFVHPHAVHTVLLSHETVYNMSYPTSSRVSLCPNAPSSSGLQLLRGVSSAFLGRKLFAANSKEEVDPYYYAAESKSCEHRYDLTSADN